jgi:5'-nucleotidase
MKRREFIRNTALITGASMVAPSVFGRSIAPAEGYSDRLTILHTNDTHSNIDPFPDNHAKYPGKGGVSRRFELIKKIRQEQEHVLLLDAGDIFQGTPYFNKYKGVLEMKVMTKLGYEAATMGNHDFDGGIDGFLNAQQYADFPFLCSNYDFKNTALDGLTKDTMIIQKGRVKVGIFGVGVELDGLVSKSNYLETKYHDPIEIATDKAAALKKDGCDLIICLSHLGYSYDYDKVSDLKLAEATQDIHLIIGGHTHTFLDKPTEVKNKAGETVLINQVGWAGVNLGRVDFEFDKKCFNKRNSYTIQ